MLRRIKPREQQAATPLDGLAEDGGDLGWRLRRAEYGLGDAGARLATPVEGEVAHGRSCRKAAPRR